MVTRNALLLLATSARQWARPGDEANDLDSAIQHYVTNAACDPEDMEKMRKIIGEDLLALAVPIVRRAADRTPERVGGNPNARADMIALAEREIGAARAAL